MSDAPALPSSVDVVVIGSGCAGLCAALVAAADGLDVIVLEKSDLLGGTSAMSGAGTWLPANSKAREAGIADSEAEALTYLESASPEGWAAQERERWRAFVKNADAVLAFLERVTPLRFELVDEPDPFAEAPGGKRIGRMVSPRALGRRVAQPFADRIRPSTMPHFFTYREAHEYDFFQHPVRSTIAIAPRLLRRFLRGEVGQGSALIAGLLAGCLQHNVVIAHSARARRLSLTDRRVAGVEFEIAGAARSLVARRGVVLATGGFEWNASMMQRYFPGLRYRLGSPATNCGEGHAMAEAVGAQLSRMNQANFYPALPTLYEGQVHALPAPFQVAPAAILVNRFGRRFASEYEFNIGEKVVLIDRDTATPANAPVWLIGDWKLKRNAVLMRQAKCDSSFMREAATIADLARQIELPAETLATTVAQFNRFARGGHDAEFRRGQTIWERYISRAARNNESCLQPIEGPPFVALDFRMGLLGTKGGLLTNANGRVLDHEGCVIEGFYCAGNAMANPIGTRAVGPGTSIGPNLTWGYICGRSLVTSKAREMVQRA
jgi:3-oxosteroid 1-dehydrogenase